MLRKMPEIKVKKLRKFQLNDKRKNVKVKLHRLEVLAVHHSVADGCSLVDMSCIGSLMSLP